MTVTTSLVSELTSRGYKSFDQSVPEDTPLPYVWLGLGGAEDWDLMEPDAEPMSQQVDVEAWGVDVKEVGDRVRQLRQLLGTWQPGPFGSGVLAGIRVEDQDENYQFRNIEGDDRLAVATLRLTFYQYREN